MWYASYEETDDAIKLKKEKKKEEDKLRATRGRNLQGETFFPSPGLFLHHLDIFWDSPRGL